MGPRRNLRARIIRIEGRVTGMTRPRTALATLIAAIVAGAAPALSGCAR